MSGSLSGQAVGPDDPCRSLPTEISYFMFRMAQPSTSVTDLLPTPALLAPTTFHCNWWHSGDESEAGCCPHGPHAAPCRGRLMFGTWMVSGKASFSPYHWFAGGWRGGQGSQSRAIWCCTGRVVVRSLGCIIPWACLLIAQRTESLTHLWDSRAPLQLNLLRCRKAQRLQQVSKSRCVLHHIEKI